MKKTNKGNYRPKYFVEPADVHKVLENYMLADGMEIVLGLDASRGADLYDDRSSDKYLDFFTCFASMPIGMNHPKITDDSFKNYIANISLNKISNSDIYTSALATFVKTFFEIAVPSYFRYSFFIEGGALAVENALKAAFDWKVRMNFKKGHKSEKGHKIIHFKQAFHGRSGYTMSLTNTDVNKVKYFPHFDWPRIDNPNVTFPLDGDNLQKVIEAEKKAVADIVKSFDENKDDIAAIIIEPIQGEGGDNHFRPEFFKELRRLADENEALLIFDEIQTGVGLTGSMWAHQQLGVRPDILVFGKKMQVCGILSTGRIDEVEDNVFKKSSRINSTWGGNLVDMVRATRYLEIIQEEKLVENAREMGQVLMSKLYEIADEFAGVVSNVRGMGLFCAFDIKAGTRDEFISKCYDRKLIILSCGENSVRFRPPLNITESEIERGMAIVRSVVAEL